MRILLALLVIHGVHAFKVSQYKILFLHKSHPLLRLPYIASLSYIVEPKDPLSGQLLQCWLTVWQWSARDTESQGARHALTRRSEGSEYYATTSYFIILLSDLHLDSKQSYLLYVIAIMDYNRNPIVKWYCTTQVVICFVIVWLWWKIFLGCFVLFLGGCDFCHDCMFYWFWLTST